eukprot:CAMPEP_0170392934 /NCGR_PEP_ID=MMETSP0117_2-20130122/20454_1 /TAXON_ID=400756 /ORGANISM="Durinskia baltica, Strain CSIRO CS-38" /LENGTH=333 /DNA_ID=CAMNT_0010649099 /DNA_START=34 /DNA_END=1035 /DNA_ORIENTATION=-
MKLLLREGCIIRKGANCVIGFPSVGNVGQIAVDHVLRNLVNSSSSQYVGCIESDFILPMAGYFDFKTGESHLCLPIELWEIPSSNTIIVLQRSLCVRGTQKKFSEELFKLLATDLEPSTVILLTGASTENMEPTRSRGFFSITTSLSSQAALSTLFPALFDTLEGSSNNSSVNTILPDVENLIRLSGLMNVGDVDADDGAGNSANLYSFEAAGGAFASSGNLEYGGSANERGNFAVEVALQGSLATTLPRGMTSAKHLLMHVLLAQYRHTNRVDESSSSSNNNNNKNTAASADDHVISNILVLGKFCAEGDNTIDGHQLGEVVLRHVLKNGSL